IRTGGAGVGLVVVAALSDAVVATDVSHARRGGHCEEGGEELGGGPHVRSLDQVSCRGCYCVTTGGCTVIAGWFARVMSTRGCMGTSAPPTSPARSSATRAGGR